MSEATNHGTPDSAQEHPASNPNSANTCRTLKLEIYDPDGGPAPGVPYERRKKKDWVWLAADSLSVLSWVLISACIALIAKAQPKVLAFFDSFFGTHRSMNWDTMALQIAFFLIVAALITCVVGIVFKLFRNRRKTDKLGVSRFIAAVVSLVLAIILGFTAF